MPKFVVVIDGYFTRDGQVYAPEDVQELNHEEMTDDFCERMEKDILYRDICHRDIYLGFYDWDPNDIDGLLTYVGARHGYPKGILQAYKISERKGE